MHLSKIKASLTKNTIIITNTLILSPSIITEANKNTEITSKFTITNKTLLHFQTRAIDKGRYILMIIFSWRLIIKFVCKTNKRIAVSLHFSS